MTPKAAVLALRGAGEAQKAREMAAYHKAERVYLGVSNPKIDAFVKTWRSELDLVQRVELAAGLWTSNIHEARIAAGKLLTQNRMPDDRPVWDLITSCVPDFDAWAIADHASIAGQKRLVENPARLQWVEGWTTSSQLWTKRAALVMTLPWARQAEPSPKDLDQRERILGWAASYVPDHDWFIQKAVAWWLRELSKRDPVRARQFLDDFGPEMKAFARREASRYL